MKAFEEWKKKRYSKMTDFQVQCEPISIEETWRAALEFALEEGCDEGDAGMEYASPELQKKFPEAYIRYIDADRLRKELNE